MPKISNLNAKSIIIKFVLKSIILTALSISALSTIFSFAVLKFDLDLIICKYCGYVTCAFSSFIVPTLCLKGFKHNHFSTVFRFDYTISNIFYRELCI